MRKLILNLCETIELQNKSILQYYTRALAPTLVKLSIIFYIKNAFKYFSLKT